MKFSLTIYDNESNKYYQIIQKEGESLAIFNQDGEGMSIKDWSFFAVIDKYFKENF